MVFQGKKYQMNEKYVCSLVTKISAKSSLSIADTNLIRVTPWRKR